MRFQFALRPACAARAESGVTIPFIGIVISLIFLIAALVVDHSKEEIAVTNLQRAADSAALAAARRLNGRVDGWWDSKKAAVVALKRNSVLGADNEALARIKLTEGNTSFWESSTGKSSEAAAKAVKEKFSPPQANEGIATDTGVLNVKVERGLYWADSKSPTGYRFSSLEEGPDGKPIDDGRRGNIPFYIVANAVRVTVELERLDTTFGRLAGISVFENLKRESVAVMDHVLTRPVAPIGIPLCQLLFNTDPNVTTGDHLSTRFEPNLACERPTYVAETNAKGDLSVDLSLGSQTPKSGVITFRDRTDGRIRAESAERNPYFERFKSGKNLCFKSGFAGSALNCKALPIYATLGIPATAPGQETDAERVVQALEQPPTAHVGSYFSPLPTLQGLTDASMRRGLAYANQTSTLCFGDAFREGNAPTRNYPFLRTVHQNVDDPQGRPPLYGDQTWYYDQTITMPAPGRKGATAEIQFLMRDMADAPGLTGFNSQLAYTNPMCHDEGIPHNDPEEARVLETYAMVIAPGLEEYGGDVVRYCDFGNVFKFSDSTGEFNSAKQRAVAPIADSKPIVVGFIKANIFDFNFQILATRPDGDTDPRNPDVEATDNTPVYFGGNGALWDGNSYAINLGGEDGFGDVFNNRKEFFAEYDTALACTPTPLTPCPTVPSVTDKTYAIPNSFRDCFDFGPIDGAIAFLKEHNGQSGGGNSALASTVNFLKEAVFEPIYARPDQHCLPRLKDGQVDKNNPASYEDLRNLVPGLGCGAMRARFDCGSEDTLIPTGKDWNDNSPTLVSVAAS